MFCARLFILLWLICLIDACSPDSYHWAGWSGCSKSCGGGSRHRTKYSCVWGIKGSTEHGGCNEFCRNGHPYRSGRCHCPSWRTGSCCETCRNVYIAHCRSGRQNCGGSPDNVRCTECLDPYYSGGYGKGCLECPAISNCNHRHCTYPGNNKCIKCNDDNVFFKRTTGDTKCERLCAWNNHFCWPGKCGDTTPYFTKNCQCDHGFRLVNNNGETSCQPTKAPAIETCLTTFVGGNGEQKQSPSSNITSTACEFRQDIYGNFQLKRIQYNMLVELTIHVSTPRNPTFIKESNFGVTDVSLLLKKKSLSGIETDIGRSILMEDKSKSTNAIQEYSNKANISTPIQKYELQNGEWLCVHYECLGGGYLTAIDTSKSTHVELDPTPYRKTRNTKTICYRYDNAPPVHCKEKNICTDEPLYIKDRVTRSQDISLHFTNWLDPVPISGSSFRASSIESYRITVHQTIPSKEKVQVDTGNVFTRIVNSTETSMTVNLTSDTPMLYCIVLEVKDVADNVKQARRFALYDNSSQIEIDPANRLYVKSASVNMNYTWQTHHNDLCLDWKGRFLNKFYLNNPFLNPIEPDRNGLISGVYDQIDGLLPVSGTENVHGIVNFKVSWNVNNGSSSNVTDVPNMTNQTYCKHFDLTDGQTYTFTIKATDIANNQLEDITTVHIDRSVPHIKNIWLLKGDHKSLFVHDTKELSTMSLYFEALDPHSGIRNVKWAFGTTDSGMELLNGMLSPDIIKENLCLPNLTTCYCPDVGKCEISSYTIPLNKLVEANKNLGNHNRNYYFSIKVTNNALLSNIEHVEVLVDDSPPETGAVLEGPVGSPDIDYTSDKSIMVNWHGFIDHESGINVYKVGIASICLSNDELLSNNRSHSIEDYAEVPYTVRNVRLKLNKTGTFFVSIIAMNNAMEPSNAVCSDGVTRDISPPFVKNLTLLHAGWSESIGCLNGKPWLIDSSLTKVQLQPTVGCLSKCLNETSENPFIQAMPTQHQDNTEYDISDFLCQTLPEFTDENIIYIPDDYIFMEWEIDENLSQIDDYFIGFGGSAFDIDSPSLVRYTSTNRRTYFKRRHEGIGSNTLFYIFLKTVSKAGLSRVLTIGPVLIDVTPPLKSKLPVVEVLDETIKVSWDNHTFYDNEQASPITQIMFQFATDQGIASPIHEWRMEIPNGCIRCFTYPLRKLQAQDNDNGYDFYVKLFVHNMAGHFLEMNSQTFQLPSRYPPGHAIVYDIDPALYNYEASPKDIDVHFTTNVLCVSWEGFKHHEKMHFEIGVGIDKNTDSIIQFYSTNTTKRECINSTDIHFDRKYFVLVRAICSGGRTISSSNGIRLLNVTNLMDSLTVKIGKRCEYETPIYAQIITKWHMGINFTIYHPLRVGSAYQLKFTDENNGKISPKYILVSSRNADIRTAEDQIMDDFVPFVPYEESPMFDLNPDKSLRNISSITISVMQCGDVDGLLPVTDQIPMYWYFNKEIPKSFRYEVTISSVDNEHMNSSKTITDPVIVHDNSRSNYTLTMRTPYLESDGHYRAEIKVCSHEKCYGPVYSKEVKVINTLPAGTIESAHAQIHIQENNTCLDVSATWKDYIDESGMVFYTWTISTDVNASSLLTSWRTTSASSKTQYKIQECLLLPVYADTTMFICVRGYANVGTMGQVCRKLIHLDNTTLPINTVYDFDTSTNQWENIKQVAHSSNIGAKMRILHDNELNIGSTNSIAGGAMIYATERTVSWYLMKYPYTPTSCQEDDDCIEEITTDIGFVIFSRHKIHPNIPYYICTHANESSFKREYFEETFPEISSCSNGFLIDDAAPKVGRVMLNDHNGYINSRNVEISWADFTDNVDGTVFGYTGNISYYQLKLGYTAGYDDIIKATNTSDRIWTAASLNVTDGSTVYASITAFDHSGQNTTLMSKGYHVDTSPPIVGDIILGNTIVDQLYSSSSDIRLHLRNFKDEESGVDHFEIGIGSMEYNDDIIPTRRFLNDDVHIDLPGNVTIDGYRYYIGVTTVNRAGLSSRTKFVPLVFDKTPPIAGQVMDGDWAFKTDVDFQSTIDAIHGHWKGFVDQHSSLSHYRVGLGTRPHIDDVKRMLYVGLTEDISWRGAFVPGQKYYITVEACNGAGLCQQLSSDGITLDNSPPISGLVKVGTGSHHQNYQRYNSSIRINWAGFEDPQSSIERFEACIGEKPFVCDHVPLFSCLLQSNIIKTGIDLPRSKALYATVIAYNKVGMNVTQSSDYFIIDDSAPINVLKPTFLLDYNSLPGSHVQWERSVLRVHWEFEDKESPIVRHELSLLTHHEGHTPVEHMELGNTNQITINLDGKNWLHNGDTYSVLVTSCNVAGHCSTEQSDDLLIDSTPPFLGGFKPPMTWENYISLNGTITTKLLLTWYDFQDEESGIKHYFITASKTYSGQELTDGIVRIPNNNTSSEVTANITLTQPLAVDDLMILTIWAQNAAGLNSTEGKISVNALLTSKSTGDISSQKGILEIEKHSCDIHFCNNDCTCAIVGQPCIGAGHAKPCQQLNTSSPEKTESYQDISVKGGFEHRPQTITASSACIAGHWTLNDGNFTHNIIRFEWSVGLKDQPIGEGIFDLATEIPWNDIGLHRHFIHCLSTNSSIIHGEKYVIYVRAWYDFDLFMEFRSSPMVVDSTAPTLRRGRFVKDSDTSCIKDFDVIDWTDTITACWGGVFGEQQGNIMHYSVSLGSSRKADDIIATKRVGLNTSFTMNNLTLTHGTRYYFTVTAYNNVGIHTITVSDGFLIDTDEPTTGIVFNTRFHTNEPFQSSNQTFSISWHGFTDHFSGIHSYFVALVNETESDKSKLTFINVGLQTSYTFEKVNLVHGYLYAGVVKAMDSAGHFSELVLSSYKKIDTTAPLGFSCTNFELIDEIKSIELHNISKNLILTTDFIPDTLYVVQASVRTNDTYIKASLSLGRLHLRQPLTITHDGLRQLEHSFISPVNGSESVILMFESDSPIYGSASIRKCTNMREDGTKALTIQQIGPDDIVVTILTEDDDSSIHETLVGAGSTYGGFQIRPLSPIYGITGGIIHVDVPHATPVYVTAIVENYSGLKSRFRAEAIIMDHTPPIIDGVSVMVNYSTGLSTSLGETLVISADWKVHDDESGIKACYCAIGNIRYSTNVVDMWHSDSLLSCQSPDLDLGHGRVVFVTVRCVNDVELLTEVVSNPLTIVQQPPEANKVRLSFVRLNEEANQAVSNTTFIQTNDSHIQIQWSGFSDLSNISYYEYRLLHTNTTVIDWTNSGQRTMATIVADHLTSGNVYTAEVKAHNDMYDSSIVSSSLLIYNDQPRLTGTPILMTRTDRTLHLDWSGVFEKPRPTGISRKYILSIGTRPGYNDVADSLHLSAQSRDILLPVSTMITIDVVEVFVSLTCYFNTGASTVYTTSFKM